MIRQFRRGIRRFEDDYRPMMDRPTPESRVQGIEII